REFDQPGDHVWYNLSFHVTLCRAGLAGDAQAKTLCLKSADALIRLAHETDYRFFGPGILSTSTGGGPEMGGVFVLYMMLCYELSPEPRFLEEAKRAAEPIRKWTFR